VAGCAPLADGITTNRLTAHGSLASVQHTQRGPAAQDINHLIIIIMSVLRVLLAILFPPLAVADKGCGSVLIVFLLTLCGWIPGVIGALVILNRGK
jgi:uncharacterized membrane protein YqaE (UPF0057 family)